MSFSRLFPVFLMVGGSALTGAAHSQTAPSVSLSTFACPTVAVSGVPFSCTATLRNTGTVAAPFSGPGTSSNNLFVPEITGCTTPLAPGAICSIKLNAVINVAGVAVNAYSLNVGATTVSKNLSVNVQSPKASLSMTRHGSVEVGSRFDASHTLSNTGTLPATLTLPATISGTNATAFSVISSDCPTQLAVGGTCKVVTRCAPTAVAAKLAATLTVPSNTSPAITGALSCTGVAPTVPTSMLSLLPNPLDFGGMPVSSPKKLDVTFKNNSQASINILNTSISGGGSASFQLSSKTCGASLPAGGTCSFSITASSAIEGSSNAVFKVLTDATGTQPEIALGANFHTPSLTFSPDGLNFGTVDPGTSRSLTVKYSNNGSVPATIGVQRFASSTNSGYTVTGACNSKVIPVGGNCTETVIFKPTVSGSYGQTLIAPVADGSNLAVPLTGVSNAPLLPTLSFEAHPHSDVELGDKGTATHKVINSGTGAASFTASGFSSAGAGLKVLSTTCGATLAPGATCDVVTECAPTSLGTFTATITRASNAVPALSGTVACKGVPKTAKASLMEVTPLSINLGNVRMGALANPVALTLRNKNPVGTPAVPVSGLRFAEGHVKDFKAATGGTCGATVAPQQACTVLVTGSPLDTGVREATGFLDTPLEGSSLKFNVAMEGAFPNITAKPTALAFGTVHIGVEKTLPVTLTNTGKVALVFGALNISAGGSGGFSVVGNCSFKTIAAGQSCVETVKINATTAGTFSSKLIAPVTDGVPAEVALSATATPPPKPILTVSMAPHGKVPVGTSLKATHTIKNTGTATANFNGSTFSVTGTGFSFVSSTCGSTLAVNATCTVTTQCSPPAITAYDGKLSRASTSQPEWGGNLSCEGVAQPLSAAAVTMSPATAAFGSVKVGEPSAPFTLSINNNNAAGSPVISLTNIVISGTNAAEFSRTGGTCTSTLMPKTSCTILVSVNPSVAASRSAKISVTTSVAGKVLSANLTATGVKPALTPSVTSLSFGKVMATTATPLTVTYSNKGKVSATLGQQVLAAGATPGFSVKGNCSYKTLASGETCVETVTYSPTAAGTGKASLSVPVTGGTALTISLSGTALPYVNAVLGVNVAPHGNVEAGTVKQASHTLTNSGTTPLTFTGSFSVTGMGFGFVSSTCPTSLAPGASCNVVTKCAPSAPGALTGKLSRGSNSSTPLASALSCTATAKTVSNDKVTVTPLIANFGTVALGSSSNAVTITVKNGNPAGTPALGISSVTVSGTNAADFVKTGGTCATSLAPAASCTVILKATPAAIGNRTATLNVATTLPGGPVTSALNVSASAPAASSFSVTPQNVSFGSVNAGIDSTVQTVNVKNNGKASGKLLSITPSANAAQTFKFGGTCSAGKTLAKGASCTYTVTVNGANTATALGSKQASTSFAFDGGSAAITVTYDATIAAAPQPTSSMNISCPSKLTVGVTTSCDWVLTNPGSQEIAIGSMTAIPVAPATATKLTVTMASSSVCSTGSTMPGKVLAGGTCTRKVNLTPKVAGNYTVEGKMLSPTKALLGIDTAQVTAEAATLALTTGTHASTKLKTTSTANHTLKNTGNIPVLVKALSFSGTYGLSVNATSCNGKTLAAGQSCTVVSTCNPTTVKTYTGTLTATTTPAVVAKGSVSCVATN